MNADEELKTLKQGMLKRVRRQAVFLAVAAVVTLISGVFGFTQNIESKKQRYVAVSNQEQIVDLQQQLSNCQKSR